MTPDVALGWPLVKDLLSRLPLSVLRCPDLSHLLDAQHAHYAFTKTFSDSKDQPLVVFTTSGTTGTAKPVIFSHDFAASLVKVKLLEPPAGFLRWNSAPQGTRMFLTLAFFHVSQQLKAPEHHPSLPPWVFDVTKLVRRAADITSVARELVRQHDRGHRQATHHHKSTRRRPSIVTIRD